MSPPNAAEGGRKGRDGDGAGEALARSVVYRFLADLAFDPDPDEAPLEERAARDGDRALEAACRTLERAGYDPSAVGPVRELRTRWRAAVSRGDVAREYVRAFGHTVSERCPPYEAQYGVSHLFQQTRSLADVAGFYRAFGMEVRRGAGVRPDHLGVELEFMSFLTLKEAYALRHHGSGRAAQCRDAQGKFLAEHLGAWTEDFSRRLEGWAGAGLFGLYATALRRYLMEELAQLGVVPTRRKKLRPRRRGGPVPACAGCRRPYAGPPEEAP